MYSCKRWLNKTVRQDGKTRRLHETLKRNGATRPLARVCVLRRSEFLPLWARNQSGAAALITVSVSSNRLVTEFYITLYYYIIYNII